MLTGTAPEGLQPCPEPFDRITGDRRDRTVRVGPPGRPRKAASKREFFHDPDYGAAVYHDPQFPRAHGLEGLARRYPTLAPPALRPALWSRFAGLAWTAP